MATLFTSQKFQVVGPNGPIPGAQVFTYAAGTLTPLSSFTDQGGLSANTNPVITGADGRVAIWLGSSAYRIRVYDSVANGGALLDDVDNISPYATLSDVAAASAGVTTLRADLADTSAPTKNAGLVGYLWSLTYAAGTVGWGILTASTSYNALRAVPVSEWAAILDGTSTYDATAAINAVASANRDMYFPAGRWNISATTGITVYDGMHIRGAGKNRTIFWAILGTGGSTGQIAAYTAGSIFKRQFNASPGTNQYVSNICFSDFGVILNHPTASITTTAIQVAIDMRNITRSEIQRVHVGNYAPAGSLVVKADPPANFAQQGYGVVYGNVSSLLTGTYAGGEGHTISESHSWGAYKLIVQDDLTLSPGSAAHAVKVRGCDLQGGHHGLVQESQYATGCSWSDNTIQFAFRQSGDASPTYIMRMTGYNNTIYGAQYNEIGANSDFLLKLENASIGNVVTLGYFSASAGCAITDLGTNNEITYHDSTATLPAVNSAGKVVNLFNKAYRRVYAKFHWDGVSAFVIDEAVGVASINRTGAGDYTVVLSKQMPTRNWVGKCDLSITSGNPGAISVSEGSQSATNFRFFSYRINPTGPVVTQVDPLYVYFSGEQV